MQRIPRVDLGQPHMKVSMVLFIAILDLVQATKSSGGKCVCSVLSLVVDILIIFSSPCQFRWTILVASN